MSSSNLALGLSETPPATIPEKVAPRDLRNPIVTKSEFSETTTDQLSQSRQKLPPMLEQYVAHKQTYSECLLFFQVGDFYELFFEDARIVSEKLNLTLTSRDKSSDNPIPLCGVPISAVDGYIERLVDLGYSVCVVSQLNSQYASRLPTHYKESEASGAKVQIQRAVTRIVTPGVRLLGNSDQYGTVAALSVEGEDRVAVAWTTVQSGFVTVRENISLANIRAELKQIGASEVVFPRICLGQSVDLRSGFVKGIGETFGKTAVKIRATAVGSRVSAQRSASAQNDLLKLSGEGKKAVALLTSYIEETTLGSKLELTQIQLEEPSCSLMISSATRDNLELIRNAHDGSVRGTLLDTINETRSTLGRRLLASWICAPSCELSIIEARQDAVESLMNPSIHSLRERLSELSDLERNAARLELNVIGPRELHDLRASLRINPRIQQLLSGLPSKLTDELSERLTYDAALLKVLETQLAEDPPQSLQDGSVIRTGFNQELDDLRVLRQDSNSWIAQFEENEKIASGISSLKVRFNLVLGYFIEVTRTHASKVPARYQRKQSTATTERYTTEELREREKLVLGAGEKEAQLELKLYAELKVQLLPFSSQLRKLSQTLAQIDCLQSLSYIATRLSWNRPVLVEESLLDIEAGEHPVLSKLLEGQFIANSLEISPQSANCIVLTGPNMGGKSTYLRQAGLIVILAQIGSFVPAARATIGLCDKLFARIGASDNIVEGESTFMVEMRETAQILSNATHRSLLLIDEVGRGTSTSDGLAISQAVLEHIASEIKCRTLFATHFHELTDLESKVKGLKNACVKVVEQDDEIIFTHEIIGGLAGKSYGLEVAKIAGIPSSVIKRASGVMLNVQTKTPLNESRMIASKYLPPLPIALIEDKSPVEEALKILDVDSLSPREALTKLYDLQRLAGE